MELVPVAAGGGDNAAGAVGAGVVDDGDALLSLGTSGVLFVAGRAFRPNPERAVHAFCHALPGRWHQMSVMLSAASALDWAARVTGTADTGVLVAKAQARGRLDGREIFLPYLSGEPRLTTTRWPAAYCLASIMTRMRPQSAKPCSKVWPSASPAGSMP